MSFGSYNSKQEVDWNSLGPLVRRRRSLGSPAAVAAAAAAFLGIVFLLFSCGVSIIRSAKATHARGSRRHLSSSEDEGPCEQAATGAAEAVAEGVAATEAATAVRPPYLNPLAAPFIPGATSHATAQDASEGIRGTIGDTDLSAASTSEASEPLQTSEKADEEVLAAQGAAAQADDATPAVKTSGAQAETKELDLLWSAEVHKAVPHSPFWGAYLGRLRELGDYCRHHVGYLGQQHALRVAQHVMRFGVIELCTLAPFCTGELDKQLHAAANAYYRLARAMGAAYPSKPSKAPTVFDNLLGGILPLINRESIPPVKVQRKAHAEKHILPPAGAALRHMATAINTLMRSQHESREGIPDAVVTAQCNVMDAVTEERLLQALSEDGAIQGLEQLQGRCTPGTIFNQAHIRTSQAKYSMGYGSAKADSVYLAATHALQEAAAETGDGKGSTMPGEGATGAAAVALAKGHTALGPAASTTLEQQRHEQQLLQRQQQPEDPHLLGQQMLQQSVPSPVGAYVSPVRAGPASPQEVKSSAAEKLKTAAEERPDAATGDTAKTGKAMKEGLLGLPLTVVVPPLPLPNFPPMLRFGGSVPHLQSLPYIVERNPFSPQMPSQGGRQQQQGGPWVTSPQQRQQLVPPQPQQQQQHIGTWSPFSHPQQHPTKLWVPSPQQQQPWKRRDPLLPQQEPEQWLQVAGRDDPEAGRSYAFSESFEAAAYLSSPSTSKTSPAESRLHKQKADKSSGSEGDADDASVPHPDFDVPAIASPPLKTTALDLQLPQRHEQHQRQRLQPVSAPFRGTDYTTPSALPEETSGLVAQLPKQQQQQQQQQTQRTSSDIWQLQDIASKTRADILSGSLNAGSTSTQYHALGENTPPTSAQSQEGDGPPTELLGNALKRKRMGSSDDK